RLALGDDQVSGAQMGVGLALGPGGVQRRAPALERAEHVQALDDVFAVRRLHATVIAPVAPAWEVTPGRGFANAVRRFTARPIGVHSIDERDGQRADAHFRLAAGWRAGVR